MIKKKEKKRKVKQVCDASQNQLHETNLKNLYKHRRGMCLTVSCKHLLKFFNFPIHFIEVVSDLTIEIDLTVLTLNIVCCHYLY